ncbi:hypothetical protein ACN47E_006236 [Coniothyrium glycines]
MIDPILHTPRLTLIRLTDTNPGSHHVQWFHENWTDVSATAWSLHGPCTSVAESREWMTRQLTEWDNWFYAVFEKPDGEKDRLAYRGDGVRESGGQGKLGTHLGSVSLRLQRSGPTLMPPASFDGDAGQQVGKEVTGSLNLRVIGYALFDAARGKGVATEASQAVLDAYRASITPEERAREMFYVEGAVDEGNPGSVSVLKKLGFMKVGWKNEEKVWLAGGWRDGVWVYGLYL